MTVPANSTPLCGLVRISLACSLLALAGCAAGTPAVPGVDSLLSASEHRENLERQRARERALDAPVEREPPNFEDSMAEGDHFKASGNASRAYLAYRRAQTLEPENPLPRRRIAFLAIREEPVAARNLFAELLQSAPTDAGLLYGLAFAELQSGRISAARSALDLAVALNPEFVSAQKLLGVVCDRMDDREAAQHHYRRALESEPNDLSTLNNLGVSLLLSDDYEQAAQALGKAVALGSTDAATLTNLGLALAFLGRSEAALDAFRRAGSEGDAYNNLGYALMLQGEKDAARVYYEKALLANDTDEDRVIRNLLQLDSAIATAAWTTPRAHPAPEGNDEPGLDPHTTDADPVDESPDN